MDKKLEAMLFCFLQQDVVLGVVRVKPAIVLCWSLSNIKPAMSANKRADKIRKKPNLGPKMTKVKKIVCGPKAGEIIIKAMTAPK